MNTNTKPTTSDITSNVAHFLNILAHPDANAEYERETNVGSVLNSDLDEEDLRYIAYQITGIIYWLEAGSYDEGYYRSLVLDLLSYDPIGLSYINKVLHQNNAIDQKKHHINDLQYTIIADEARKYVNLTDFEYYIFAIICMGIADPKALQNWLPTGK